MFCRKGVDQDGFEVEFIDYEIGKCLNVVTSISPYTCLRNK